MGTAWRNLLCYMPLFPVQILNGQFYIFIEWIEPFYILFTLLIREEILEIVKLFLKNSQ